MKERLSPRLGRALEAFESGELDLVVRNGTPEDFQALRNLVSMDVEAEYRQRAMYALGKWGDQSVVLDLASILPQLDESGRITAVVALGRLGSKEAVSAVEGCAEDPSPEVRKFVVEALDRMGGKDASATLRRMSRQDPKEWVRSLAERASRLPR